MTDTQQAEVAAPVDTTATAPEAVVSNQDAVQQTDARDYEAEARENGWVPETDFKGPKEKWKPAQQFVEDGETILPIVRSQNKRLQAELEKRSEEFTKRLERIEKMNKEAVQRQKASHEAELASVRKEMRRAVEDGDTALYDQLEAKRDGLAKQTFEEEPAKSEDPAAAWAEKNPWYRTDFEKADKATRYSQWLAQQNPDMTLEANLAHTEEYMKKEHPELFGGAKKTAATNGHAAVDGGGAFPGAGKKEGPAAKLPAEAKRQAEIDVKAGLYKTTDEWAKAYFS